MTLNIKKYSKAAWRRLRDGRKLKIQQFGSSLRGATKEGRASANLGLPWGVERAFVHGRGCEILIETFSQPFPDSFDHRVGHGMSGKLVDCVFQLRICGQLGVSLPCLLRRECLEKPSN